MKSKEKYSKIKLTILYLTGYLIMIGALLGISYTIIQLTLDQNVKTRTFDELKAKVKMQVAMIDQIIDREYAQLRIVESVLLFQNEEAEKEQFDKIWESMREKENAAMLGFSDMSGNVINCSKKELGGGY